MEQAVWEDVWFSVCAHFSFQSRFITCNAVAKANSQLRVPRRHPPSVLSQGPCRGLREHMDSAC